MTADELTRELHLPGRKRRLRPAALVGLVIFLLLLVAGGAYAFFTWFLQGGAPT